MQQLNY